MSHLCIYKKENYVNSPDGLSVSWKLDLPSQSYTLTGLLSVTPPCEIQCCCETISASYYPESSKIYSSCQPLTSAQTLGFSTCCSIYLWLWLPFLNVDVLACVNSNRSPVFISTCPQSPRGPLCPVIEFPYMKATEYFAKPFYAG